MTHPFSHAVDAYVKQLQKAFAQGDATEHAHRPALKQLLEASSTKITATNEPKAAERENKPDYIVRRGSSIIGFVEAKDIDADLKKALKTPQLKRYLEALPNLLLTNYTDFIWFVGGEKRMEISLAAVNGKAITPAPALYTTAVTEAEIRVGISMMPTGKRTAQLQATVDQTFSQVFADRILSLDSAAAVI